MRSIVVSDLHADRWDEEKLNLFLGFLNSYLVKKAGRFILNGDIFDIPSSSTDLGWPKRQDKLLTALTKLATRIPFVYITGNHDLATKPLGPMTIMSGLVQIEPEKFSFNEGNNKFILKHGYQYDPLYNSGFYKFDNLVKNLADIDIGIEAEQIIEDMEERFGNSIPTEADRAQFYKEELVKTQATNQWAIIGIPNVLDYIWIHAASQLAEAEDVNNVIFGHTHTPEQKPICHGRALYTNSGDWVAHTTYVLIERDFVKEQNWPNVSFVDRE